MSFSQVPTLERFVPLPPEPCFSPDRSGSSLERRQLDTAEVERKDRLERRCEFLGHPKTKVFTKKPGL